LASFAVKKLYQKNRILQNRSIVAILLAAGEGVRMKSGLAKVLHQVSGRPMVQWVISAVREAGVERIILVIGHRREMVRDALRDEGVEFVVQATQRGTAHAVLQAEAILRDFSGTVLVLCGDVPLLRARTIKDLLELHHSSNAMATVLTAELADPAGYGRIVRDSQGTVERIVEEKDATPQERRIREVNSGLFCFQATALLPALREVRADNQQGEYYLTDVISIFRRDNRRVAALLCPHQEEILGVNSREQLSFVEGIMKNRLKKRP